MHKHHTRARQLHALGIGRGPALRDAPDDTGDANSSGGGGSGVDDTPGGGNDTDPGDGTPKLDGDLDKDRAARAIASAREGEKKAKLATKALTERATAAEQRAAAAEEALWGATVKNEVRDLAATLGANAKALLDSVSFVDSLDELADDDPGKPEFTAALEKKIKAAIAANPALRATAGGSVRQGADFTGSGGGSTPRSTNLTTALTRKLGGGGK